jgi:nucleoside-diphosphate kinase
MREKTFVMIKPDGVRRKLIGDIIQRIERKGFVITGIKMARLTEEIAKRHYYEHRDKNFFVSVVNSITSGPVVLMIVEGENAIKGIIDMVGSTNPSEAMPGTIRFDFATSITENVIHRSDSAESACREIKIFFGDNYNDGC